MNCCLTYPQIIIISALIILLVLAIFWEVKDIQRLTDRKPVWKIKDEDKRLDELEFYACFNAENNIQWRGIFIMTTVATLLVLYVISQFYPECINANMALLIFGSIILVFYIGDIFRTFHVYRPMCGKVKKDKIIL